MSEGTSEGILIREEPFSFNPCFYWMSEGTLSAFWLFLILYRGFNPCFCGFSEI